MNVDAKSFGMTENEFARWQQLPLDVRQYLTNAQGAGALNYIDSWGRIDLWKLIPDRAEQERILGEMERAGAIVSALVRGVGLRFGLGPDNARYIARCLQEESLARWEDAK
jgi:hypothetical protein